MSNPAQSQETNERAPNGFDGGAPKRPATTRLAQSRAEQSRVRINSGKNAEEAAAQYLQTKRLADGRINFYLSGN